MVCLQIFPLLAHCTGLTTLDLSENALTAVDVGIGALTALTTLDMHSNLLTTLPHEAGAGGATAVRFCIVLPHAMSVLLLLTLPQETLHPWPRATSARIN